MGRTRGKGRPRAFDAEQVLREAARLFARQGFAATSLDALCEATGLVRPSLYNAFGDKLSLYRQAIAFHLREMLAILREILPGDADVASELTAFFDIMARREAGEAWLAICSAPADAINHPELAEDIRILMAALDQLLTARFEAAAARGELRAHVTPALAARAAQAALHGITLQARAGEAQAARATGRAAVALIARTI